MYHLLTGEVPFVSDSFMGILTKHMLEPVVPPRRRKPELGIAPDVEAVCLRALEKDREKRWQDMDAFYRALGSAGGEPFEASAAYVRTPSMRLPALAQPNALARELKTEVPEAPRVTESEIAAFNDERPVVRRSAGLKLGGVVIAVAVVAIGIVLAMRGPAKVVAPVPEAAQKPVPAPPPAPEPPAAAAAPAAGPAAAPAAVEAAPARPAEPAPRASTRAKPRRSSADLVREIGAKAGVDKEPSGAATEKPASITPAELKNPFGN
jgi:serine/threonine-protein kinase